LTAGIVTGNRSREW